MGYSIERETERIDGQAVCNSRIVVERVRVRLDMEHYGWSTCLGWT